MRQTTIDDFHEPLLNFCQDTYDALCRQVHERDLTDTETVIVHKASGILADFAENRHGN